MNVMIVFLLFLARKIYEITMAHNKIKGWGSQGKPRIDRENMLILIKEEYQKSIKFINVYWRSRKSKQSLYKNVNFLARWYPEIREFCFKNFRKV